MKRSLKTIILAGGAVNLLMGLFHIFLCYQIHVLYAGMPFYPFLQMLAIGGAMLVLFLAGTSLLSPAELVSTNTGRLIVILNVVVYFSRIVEEFIFVAVPQPVIIGACLIPGALYLYVLLYGTRITAADEAESTEIA